jgi:hypothetical protein
MTPSLKTEGVPGHCRARHSMTEPHLDVGGYRWYYCRSVSAGSAQNIDEKTA